MNYLLFGGAMNTGKSESVYKIAYYLENTKKYTPRFISVPSSFGDFQCILEKDEKVILIQSGTDQVNQIKELKRVKELNKDITHIITAIRNEGDNMRIRFEQILEINSRDYIFEIPLGKVIEGKNRGTNIVWYLERIFNVAKEIIKNLPFNF